MPTRLESLELQGVKTFATLTRLEFPGRITAIVGPNGSGKSNIADSIRWVLGEQSYSLLRAKRTEDMIFSGSEQRSRAGMASATITFNNEDGWLPIDFSEVSIARQAYRDGQNEYLLNGQKVRLKDISELLSQTGLAERTYTVIGQGLVDAALALKPDERRELFEEAAGIGLYRSRKEEALRRLEHTRKNLDRVLDIMTEIRPRLRSLEKQTERFRNYERLRSDLQVLLRDWYGFHWHEKQRDLRTSRLAYQDQEKRLNNLRQKNAEAEGKVTETRQALQETRKTLEAAHSQTAGLHRELEEVTKEMAIIDERQRSFRSQKNHLEIDVGNLQEEINQLESQKVKYQDEIAERLADYNASKLEYNRAQDVLAELIAHRDALQQELDALRQARVSLETEKVQIAARLEEIQNRIETFKVECVKLNDALQSLETEKSNAKAISEIAEKNLNTERQQLAALQDQLADINRQIDDLNQVKQSLNENLAAEERTLAKLDAELEVLNQAEAALSGYSEGSKKLVAQSRRGRLPTGILPLSQQMIVPGEYEKAISAALGELADLLVMPSKGKEIVIEYLDSQDNARVALVIPDLITHRAPGKRFSSRMGVIGYANELIEVEAPYRELVDRLFADTLVVQDRKTAQDLIPELRSPESVVTLNGLVFQANGVMISGQGASGKRLGRTRRQSEIRDEVVQVSSRMDELEFKLAAAAENLDQLDAAREALNQQIFKQEEELHSKQEDFQHALDRATRLEEQIRWNQSQLHTYENSLTKARSDIQTTEQELNRLTDAIQIKLESEKGLRGKLAEIPVLEQQQILNQWQSHSLVAENALSAARQRFEDHQERVEEVQKRLSTYQGRYQELESNLDAILDKKAVLRARMEHLSGKIAEMEAEQIDPLTSTAEELEGQASALEKLQAHSQQQVVIAERHFTQLQLELSRREDQLANLRERIEDDFGLVAFDYDTKIDGPTPLPFDESLISDLPRVEVLPKSSEADIKRLKGQIRRIGPINSEAQQEFNQVKERHSYLTAQIEDLEEASDDLNRVMAELDTLMERDFVKTFKSVNHEFSEYFSRLFNGGEASLVFSDEDNPVEGGVDIIARLPGRRQQGLALLSGGERSLTAVALIFALLKVSPTPFCVLDEVDAMLDESNVGRFAELLKELSKQTQFVIITHNRNTVQAADVIYGVTMGRDSTSQMISLKLEEVDETYLE